MTRFRIAFLGGWFLTTSPLISCGRPASAQNGGSPPVHRAARAPCVRASKHSISRRVVLPVVGVRGNYEVTIHSKVTGFVDSIRKDLGDPVAAGELIAKILVPETEERLKSAKAARDLEKATVRRYEDVRKLVKNAVSDQEYDIEVEKLRVAETEVKRLEELVDYTVIRSPFAGYVTARFVDPGAFVNQDKIVTIVDSSLVRILVDVPERDVARISIGSEAQFLPDARPGEVFSGVVARSSKSLDPVVRTMRIELDILNPEKKLMPGMFGHAVLTMETKNDALCIPIKAVDRSAVWVCDRGKLRRAAVTLGIKDDEQVEVKEGLAEGDLVILPQGGALTDGMAVEPGEEAKK